MNATHIDHAVIEAHLMSCATCRNDLADLAVGSVRTNRADHPDLMWNRVLERVDRPRRSVIERCLHRFGFSDTAARVLAVTPALRLAWFGAVGIVALLAVVASNADGGNPWPLLVLAPLLPVAGVATAFGAALDPTYEIAHASPLSGLRLTLLRTTAVLATTIPLLLAATLAVPGGGWTPYFWLLPCLALVSVTLALSSWIAVERAGAITGVAWLLSLMVLSLRDHAGDFASRSIVFGPSGQILTAFIAGAGAVVFIARREQFDIGRKIGDRA
jgi:hypothetical protein